MMTWRPKLLSLGMRTLLLLITFLTACPAMELKFLGTDFTQEDKIGHFWLGAATSGVAILALEKINPEAKWYTKMLVGTVMAAVIGAAKEGFDTQDIAHHDPDRHDFIATTTGGAAVAMTMSWKF